MNIKKDSKPYLKIVESFSEKQHYKSKEEFEAEFRKWIEHILKKY